MLNTENFVARLILEGYSHLCVVPCSFAKDLINASINLSDKLTYVPCASEAVACSVAAGLSMSGKKPIVIVQSSGLTNMGSCITSLLKPYSICFPIIVSWRTYKEGDSEIQHQHLATGLPNLVSAYGYNSEILINDLDTAILQINSCLEQTKILLLEKNTFSKVNLEEANCLDLTSYIPRSEYMTFLNKKYSSSACTFIGTTGNTAREMYSFMPDTKNFYMAGNMGGALSVGLGAYLSGNKVIVCGGDAEFVMHLGGLTTAARYHPQDNGQLIYIVFDNESNKSTGGQDTMQEHISYLGIAKESGFNVYNKTIANLVEFEDVLDAIDNDTSVLFLHVKCGYDDETPRPPLDVVKNSINTFSS